MKRIILIVFSLVSSSLLNGQVSVVLISSKDSSVVYNCATDLSKNKQFKNVNFRIVHFNEQTSSKNIQTINKINFNIKEEKMSCDFNFCDNLGALLKSDFSNSLYLYSKTPNTCVFDQVNIEETIINSTFSNEFVSEKITQQLSIFKKTGKSVSLYFNFTDSKSEKINPIISAEQNLFSVKKGDVLKLNIQSSSSFQVINWEPKEGLSCTNCLQPEFKAEKSIIYKVNYKDWMGCQSNTQDIQINVLDECDLSKKLIIPFDKINFSNFKREEGESFEYEITPIGVGGGFKYDIPTTRNCAENFKLIVKDLNGKIIVVFDKKREDIDENSNNPFVNGNPDYFVFRINLQDYYKKIQLGAIITIESYDEKGTAYKNYTSPVVSFSGCK